MTKKQKFSLLLISLSAIFVSVVAFNRLKESPTTITSSQKKKPAVLSQYIQAPRIYVSGEKSGYSTGGVLALTSTGEPAVYITSYNTSGNAQVELYRADDEALLDFLIHDKDGNQLKKNVDISSFDYLTTINHQVTTSNGEESKLTLPLDEIGIWFLRISMKETTTDAFIIRSGTGVLVKEGDNKYIFWGQDYNTRRSIKEGNLRLYSLLDNRQELSSAFFNQEGIVQTPLLAQADVAFISRGKDKVLLPINLRYLNTGYSYQQFQPKKRETKYFIFTDRPLYRPGDTVYFKAVLRNDDDARYSIPQDMARVKIYYSWDEKNTVYDKFYNVTSDGTVYGEYKLADDISTGDYQLKVEIEDSETESWWYGNVISFQVQHFRKPEYTLDIETAQKELVRGDTSSFKIYGNYFSGQPLAGQTVEYSIVAADFYQYEYLADKASLISISDDYRYGYWGGKTVGKGEVILNSSGEAMVTLDTKIAAGQGKSQVFSIEAQFKDSSGNPVFARKNVLVYSGEYGIYRTNYLTGKTVGSQYSLPVKLVPYHSSSVANIALTAKITREWWVSYQEPNKKYPSYKKETENLSPLTVTTNSNGEATFAFIPQKPGSYQIIVEGQDQRGNRLIKKFYAWIRREGEPFYTGEGDNQLIIQTDKGKYKPSENVTFTISSTIPDRDIFLSLERARVNRYQIVSLIKGNTGRVQIPLVNTDIPNIFAKISSFSDNWLDSGQINVLVSTKSKQLVVNLTPDSQKFGPGETVTVNISTTDITGNPIPADTAVWAVDKALFELVDKRPENIFETFWRQRSNDTRESHSLVGITAYPAEGGGCFAAQTPILMGDKKLKLIKDIVVGDTVLTRTSKTDDKLVKARVKKVHKQEVSGFLIINGSLRVTVNHWLWINSSWREAGSIQMGDRLTDYQGREIIVSSIEWQQGKFTVYNLEVEKYKTYFAAGVWVHNQKGGPGRSVFKDTAYWNPSVHTDENGRAQLRFKLPDNLTTWVVAAIGSTIDTKVGQTTSEIRVSKDVIVRPILPNILRIGDEAIISALVQNFTNQDHIFDIDLTFDSGRVKQATHSGVKIKANETEQVYWHINPSKGNEKAELRFSARAQDIEDAFDTITLSLPVWEFGFAETRAETGDGPKMYKVKLADDSHPKKSKITLSLSPTLLGMLPTAMKYLVNYPFGCVEQTTSRFVPAVIAKANPDLFNEEIADKDVDDIVKEGINRLAKLQHSDGGWAWWSSGASDPFVSAYVVKYLLAAKDTGIEVDENILRRAQYFFGQGKFTQSASDRDSSQRDDDIARIYALSLLGSKKGKRQLSIFTNITSDILALAVMANVRNGYTNPQTNGLNKLISMAKPQGDGAFWPSGGKPHFGSNDASTALAIQAILAGGGNRQLATKGVRYLTRNRQNRYWSNTFATAQVVRALVDFSRTGQELSPNYSYSLILDGVTIAQGDITDSSQQIKDIVIPVAQIKSDGSQLVLSKNGEGQLYSTLVIDEFHTDRNAEAMSHGLSIKREYISEKGKGYSLAVGDTVTVNFTVSGLQADDYYGVIADELPAGLIPINPIFKSEQYGQNYAPYYSSYDITDREVTKNGMILSLYRIGSGGRTYSYKARVISEGTFAVPPVIVSLMYTPEIYGRSDTVVIKTTGESKKISTKAVISPPTIEKKKKSLYANSKKMVEAVSILVLITIIALLLVKRQALVDFVVKRIMNS